MTTCNHLGVVSIYQLSWIVMVLNFLEPDTLKFLTLWISSVCGKLLISTISLLYHNMRLQALRQEVAHPRTSIQLCLLGIVGGVSAASLIIMFRLCVEWLQASGFGALREWFNDEWPVWFLMPLLSVLCICLLPISRALSTIVWVSPLLSTA